MFSVPEDNDAHPLRFYTKLLDCPEFAHLKDYEPSVAFLFRHVPEVQSGRKIIGTCSMPTVQGRHRKLFAWMLEGTIGYLPDYLFVFDHEWWEEHDARHRE